MALTRPVPRVRSAERAEAAESPASLQAYHILHFGFTVAPILAGADKFLNLMTSWEQYLAPWLTGLLPFSPATFMRIVGAVEIVAGVLVWLKPRWGAYVVAAWLVGIIVNLLTLPGYFDVALRDLGLALGALALGRLSEEHGR